MSDPSFKPITGNPKAVLPESLTRLTPPSETYFVEQFKNGTLVGKLQIKTNKVVVGRARDCDIILEHPSVSRYHAMLLWSPKNDDHYENGMPNFVSQSFCSFQFVLMF